MGITFYHFTNALTQAGGLIPDAGFDVHGVGILKVYSLLENEMEALGAASSRANITMGAFFTCFGALIAALLGALVTFPDKPILAGVYVGVTAAVFIGTILSGFLWRASQRERTGMLDMIKKRSTPPVRLVPAPTPGQAPTT